MTDDYRQFLALDETAYGPDRPGDQVLFRRIRRQVGSILEYPRGLTREERIDPEDGAAQLYAGAPRVLSYQPRRIPAGLGSYRCTVAVGGRQFDQFEDAGLTIGRIELRFRAGTTTARSGWQVVTETPPGAAKVYELTVDFDAFASDAIGELWLVGESEPVELVDVRQGGGGTAQGFGDEQSWYIVAGDELQADASDPYPEWAGYESEREGHFGDIIDDYEGTQNDWFYYFNPAAGFSGDIRIWRFASLEIPDGVEYRPQWDRVNEPADETLYAGRRPKFTPGPGELKRGLQEELGRWWPSGSGPEHESGLDASWTRNQRTPIDGGLTNESFDPSVIIRPRSSDIDVYVVAATVTFEDFALDDSIEGYEEVVDQSKAIEVDYRINAQTVTSVFAQTDITWSWQVFPVQIASRAAWMSSYAIATRNGGYEYTRRNGLPFAGFDADPVPNDATAQEGMPLGDMQFISLQTAKVEARGVNVNAPLQIQVQRQSALYDQGILWVGLTAHQSLPGAA